jgi:arginyl-tRNA synthetase
LDESELEDAAERIGIAAVKYFDLRQNRVSDYKFDYDSMLSNNGKLIKNLEINFLIL